MSSRSKCASVAAKRMRISAALRVGSIQAKSPDDLRAARRAGSHSECPSLLIWRNIWPLDGLPVSYMLEAYSVVAARSKPTAVYVYSILYLLVREMLRSVHLMQTGRSKHTDRRTDRESDVERQTQTERQTCLHCCLGTSTDDCWLCEPAA